MDAPHSYEAVASTYRIAKVNGRNVVHDKPCDKYAFVFSISDPSINYSRGRNFLPLESMIPFCRH